MRIIELFKIIIFPRQIVRYDVSHLSQEQIYTIANQRNLEVKDKKLISKVIFNKFLFNYEIKQNGKLLVTNIYLDYMNDVSAEIDVVNNNDQRFMQIKYYMSKLTSIISLIFSLIGLWFIIKVPSNFWLGLALVPGGLLLIHLIFLQNIRFIKADINHVFSLKRRLD